MNTIGANEILARYIYSKHAYRPSDHTVKHTAFRPRDGKRVSVFRTVGLNENEIWSLGETLRPKPLRGRADIATLDVLGTGLTVDADDVPPRHANITGWPAEDSAILLKAIELAEMAMLFLKSLN